MRFDVPRLLLSNTDINPLSKDSDVAIITSGICTEEALKTRNMLQSCGVKILHLHLSTIVPFPVEDILKVIGEREKAWSGGKWKIVPFGFG